MRIPPTLLFVLFLLFLLLFLLSGCHIVLSLLFRADISANADDYEAETQRKYSAPDISFFIYFFTDLQHKFLKAKANFGVDTGKSYVCVFLCQTPPGGCVSPGIIPGCDFYIFLKNFKIQQTELRILFLPSFPLVFLLAGLL